jgi:hypothetical protein
MPGQLTHIAVYSIPHVSIPPLLFLLEKKNNVVENAIKPALLYSLCSNDELCKGKRKKSLNRS